MNFKNLLVLASLFLPLFQAVAINGVNDRFGTGATIAFNTFEDARNLAADRGWGMDDGQLGACLSLPTGAPFDTGSIYQAGYPFLGDVACLENAYDTAYGDPEAGTHLNEANFAANRFCTGTSCDTADPQITTTAGNAAGTLPYLIIPDIAYTGGNTSDFCNALPTNYPQHIGAVAISGGDCNITFRNRNYTAIPDYTDSTAGLQDGDRVRVFIYLHNNAQEFDPATDPAEYTARLAENTEVTFDWSTVDTTNVMNVTIDSDQTNAIADTTNFVFAAPNLGLRPVTDVANNVFLTRTGSGETSNVNFTGGTSLVVPMGTVASSYGNVQRLYVDFEVVDNTVLNVGYDFTLTAESLTGTPYLDGEHLTVMHGIDAGDEFIYRVNLTNTSANSPTGQVILENILDPNLVFVSSPDAGVTFTGGTITFDYASIPVGGPDTEYSFRVQINPALPAAGAFITTTVTDTTIPTPPALPLSRTLTHPVGAITGGPITKTAEDLAGTNIPDGGTVIPGQTFRYRVRFENTGNVDQVVTITDTLDTNLTYIGNLGDPSITEAGGVVTMDFGTVSPGPLNAVERVFEVQVNAGVPNGTVITNIATNGTIDGQIDLVVNASTSGGGGSAPTVPAAGTCHRFDNGTYECRKSYPDWDLGDPDYVAYIDCVELDEITDDECLADWIAIKGMVGCTQPEDFTGDQLGQDPADIARQECTAPAIFVEECTAPTSKSGTGVVSVQKERITNEALPTGDTVRYEVTVNISDANDLDDLLFDEDAISSVIDSATVKVYDYPVPGQGGWLHNREVIAGDWEWVPPSIEQQGAFEVQTGNYFEKTFTRNNGGDIFTQLSLGGAGVYFQYDMDSLLMVCAAGEVNCADKDTIKNVAFTVIDFELTEEFADANQNTQVVSRAVELRSPLEVTELRPGPGGAVTVAVKDECDALYLGDIHSLGGAAEANIDIVRPFLQTRGGANLSINSVDRITGDSASVTEGDQEATSGLRFTGDLNNNLSQDAVFQDTFFDSLKQNLAGGENFQRFGVFETTPDNAGVYILEGGDFAVPDPLDLGRSETFILEEGDLLINNDIVLQGDSRDYLPAFVLREGDIKISPEVEHIEGIFIALNGEILSGEGAEPAEKQLLVSGSLVGDAFDLLKSRKYIGEFEEQTGLLVGGLQPSVKISYDLRLIDNTPPALESFLGRNWQQKAE